MVTITISNCVKFDSEVKVELSLGAKSIRVHYKFIAIPTPNYNSSFYNVLFNVNFQKIQK